MGGGLSKRLASLVILVFVWYFLCTASRNLSTYLPSQEETLKNANASSSFVVANYKLAAEVAEATFKSLNISSYALPKNENIVQAAKSLFDNTVVATTFSRTQSLEERQASGRFCVEWDENMDDWWTHNVDWDAVKEDDDGLCFERMAANDTKAVLFRRLYQNQHLNNCSRVYTRWMWSSGWGADFRNVYTGIKMGLKSGRPLAMALNAKRKNHWHYAANKKDGSNPTCPAKDMTCYFLNMTSCVASSEPTEEDKNLSASGPNVLQYKSREDELVLEYITRPQQWLRHAVYQYTKEHGPSRDNMGSPNCSVIHVRRADVVLHGAQSRKYYAIADYIESLPVDRKQPGSHIVLLTDDANAIDEAHEFFPELNWHYWNRTRHKGSEGGWENQIVSKNPKLEVVIILSTFQLAARCDTYVHGRSSFGERVGAVMKGVHGDRYQDLLVREFKVEDAKNPELNLEERLDQLRKARNGTVDSSETTNQQGNSNIDNETNTVGNPHSRRRLYVHLGPMKTGSTTIQHALVKYGQKWLMEKDSYQTPCPYRERLSPFSGPCLRQLQEAFRIHGTVENTECWKRYQKCMQSMQSHPQYPHAILSAGQISMFPIRAWKDNVSFRNHMWRLIDETWSKEHFDDVVFVAAYRRFFTWVLSYFRYKYMFLESWPKTPIPNTWPHIMTDLKRQPYIDECLDEYQVRQNRTIRILNLHQAGDLQETFFCHVLENATRTCDMIRKRSPESIKSSNPSRNLVYDRIAIHAKQIGLITSHNVTLRRAVQSAKSFHKKQEQQYRERLEPVNTSIRRNTTTSTHASVLLPLICPTRREVMPLLDKSLHFEQRVLPAFFKSQLGEATLKQEFEAAFKQNKFCTVNVSKVLEDPLWRDMFQNLS